VLGCIQYLFIGLILADIITKIGVIFSRTLKLNYLYSLYTGCFKVEKLESSIDFVILYFVCCIAAVVLPLIAVSSAWHIQDRVKICELLMIVEQKILFMHL